MSIKNDRFREMELIGKFISEEVTKLTPLLDEFSFFENDKLERYIFDFLRGKINKKPLRAYFIWKLYKYLNHYSETKDANLECLFSQKLPLVFELIITIQYLHNHILDEKLDSRSNNHPQLWQNLISSNILREVLFSYLKTEVNPLIELIEPSQSKLLRQALANLLCQVDVGQRLDKHFNHYKGWKNKLPSFDNKKWLGDERSRELMTPHINKTKKRLTDGFHFTDVYFHRIYLTNAYFFRVMAEIATSFFPNVNKGKKENLINFSILYGFMLQIINDYADFAYSPDKKEQKLLKTVAKKTTDIFADLYNFNITLPLIVHLQAQNRRLIESYLEGGARKKKTIQQFPLQIMNEILQSGGIRACIALSRDLAKAANSHLDTDNPASPYLVNMTDMANSNKFYRIFKMANKMESTLAKITKEILAHIHKGTGIEILMTINTEYWADTGEFIATPYLTNDDESNHRWIKKIKDSNEPKIVSEQKETNDDFSHQPIPLSSYFTSKNKKESRILQYEEKLIENNEIDISKGYYIAYCIPQNKAPIRKIIFLIIRNKESATTINNFLVEFPFTEEKNQLQEAVISK